MIFEFLYVNFERVIVDVPWGGGAGLVVNPKTDPSQHICYYYMDIGYILIGHMPENACVSVCCKPT